MSQVSHCSPSRRSSTSSKGPQDFSHCAIRTALVDDCARSRLLVAYMEYYLLSDAIPRPDYECPMLRCRERFPTAPDMLMHMKVCARFGEGETWCPCCYRSEIHSTTDKKGCSWTRPRSSMSQKLGECLTSGRSKLRKRGHRAVSLELDTSSRMYPDYSKEGAHYGSPSAMHSSWSESASHAASGSHKKDLSHPHSQYLARFVELHDTGFYEMDPTPSRIDDRSYKDKTAFDEIDSPARPPPYTTAVDHTSLREKQPETSGCYPAPQLSTQQLTPVTASTISPTESLDSALPVSLPSASDNYSFDPSYEIGVQDHLCVGRTAWPLHDIAELEGYTPMVALCPSIVEPLSGASSDTFWSSESMQTSSTDEVAPGFFVSPVVAAVLNTAQPNQAPPECVVGDAEMTFVSEQSAHVSTYDFIVSPLQSIASAANAGTVTPLVTAEGHRLEADETAQQSCATHGPTTDYHRTSHSLHSDASTPSNTDDFMEDFSFLIPAIEAGHVQQSSSSPPTCTMHDPVTAGGIASIPETEEESLIVRDIRCPYVDKSKHCVYKATYRVGSEKDKRRAARNLGKHCLRNHKNKSQKWPCTMCSRIFGRKDNLSKHKRKVHGTHESGASFISLVRPLRSDDATRQVVTT